MENDYSFCYFEDIASQSLNSQSLNESGKFTDKQRRISFTELVSNELLDVFADKLIDFDDYEEILKKFHDTYYTPGFIRSGIVEFENYIFYGNCALILDADRRQAIIGEPLCWGIDFAKWYTKDDEINEVFDRENSKNYIKRIVHNYKTEKVKGSAIILSAPGMDIYGHWILDIIPKLYMLSISEYKDLPIYLNDLPEWAQYFIEAFGFKLSDFKKHPSDIFKVENAIIPTGAKSGYRLGAKVLKAAWAKIPRPLVNTLPNEMRGEKIFLSRAKWQSSTRRSYKNREEIEGIARKRGYKIVAPELFTIAQQISLMQDARIIIGEDGSALHNIVFSQEDARLGVLTLPERDNLWHLGLCQILGHQIAYCVLPKNNEDDFSVEKFNLFIDKIES